MNNQKCYLIGYAAVLAGLAGCQNSASPPPSSGSFGESSAGGAESGGASSALPDYSGGGMTATGGSGGATVSAPVTSDESAPVLDFAGSTIEACEGAPAVSLPVDSFQPCNMVGCQLAHCVPAAAIPESVPIELLGTCDDPTTVCVPDDYTATMGQFIPKSCESILGAEGRCISTCIPQVNGLMDALPQGDCGENERCAPCINPNDGTETGACLQGCDPGPSQETLTNPILFPTCANDEGRCVPKEIIPAALLGQLIQMTCPSADQVCAPLEKTQNLKYNFPECAPTDGFVILLATPGPDGQLGGCVPAWLADANPLEGLFLLQDTCPAGDKCAPCNNPLRGNQPTGACPVPLPSDPTGGSPPDGG
jgi:hypothetical protein